MIAIAAVAVLCAACGNSADSKEVSAIESKTGLPDTVTVETATDALQMILNETDEDLLVMGEAPERDTTQADEASQSSMQVYYSNATFDKLIRETVSVKELTPEEALSVLARHNIVPLDAKIESFEIVESENGTTQLIMGISKSFSNYLSTMTQESKEAILASITNTYLSLFDAQELYLTVGNKSLSEIDADHMEALTWFQIPIENAEKKSE